MDTMIANGSAGGSDTYLPVSFDATSKWPGHRPGTRARLEIILSSAASRAGGPSLAERALFAACDCWSAASTGSLTWHLGVDPAVRLRSLASIYAAIGAKQTARLMELALGELPGARSEQHCQQLIARLEVAILRTRANVEELLHRFTLRLLPKPSALASRSPNWWRQPMCAGVLKTASRASKIATQPKFRNDYEDQDCVYRSRRLHPDGFGRGAGL
jgi:hypothetical protein